MLTTDFWNLFETYEIRQIGEVLLSGGDNSLWRTWEPNIRLSPDGTITRNGFIDTINACYDQGVFSTDQAVIPAEERRDNLLNQAPPQ